MEPTLRLSLSKRSMLSSSSDEDENIPAIASRMCAAVRRNPLSLMDGEIAYSSSSDEEKTSRTQGCKSNPPTSPTSPTLSDRFARSRVDDVDQAVGKDTSSVYQSFLRFTDCSFANTDYRVVLKSIF